MRIKKINNLEFYESTLDKMSSISFKSGDLNKEFGFSLCKFPDHKMVIAGANCEGDKCSVKTRKSECPKGSNRIGTFHTHPDEDNDMSFDDMIVACKEDISCVGDNKGRVHCYTRKKTEDSGVCSTMARTNMEYVDRLEEKRKNKEISESEYFEKEHKQNLYRQEFRAKYFDDKQVVNEDEAVVE